MRQGASIILKGSRSFPTAEPRRTDDVGYFLNERHRTTPAVRFKGHSAQAPEWPFGAHLGDVA
jgi:hypothetical protein